MIGRPGLIAVAIAVAAISCGSSSDKGASPADAAGGAGGSAADTAAPASLYDRLGGEKGIQTVIGDFLQRVLGDPKINGYFLNSTVDGSRLGSCLVMQVGSLTGGPQKYPSGNCRDMKSAHAGMKVSMNDFNDLAGHLVAALEAAKVPKADVDIIVGAVAPLSSDIVEDKTNNGTVYQRVGRKPAIDAVVGKFITRVVADMRINGFFGATKADRLKTCLVRQVCGVDGPCRYGKEVDGEPGVSKATPCRDMMSTHAGLTSPAGGGAGAKMIAKADFDALVEDLVRELDAAGVAAADKNALLGALGPLCNQIVAGGTGCQ
jgi:hemoglobin